MVSLVRWKNQFGNNAPNYWWTDKATRNLFNNLINTIIMGFRYSLRYYYSAVQLLSIESTLKIDSQSVYFKWISVETCKLGYFQGHQNPLKCPNSLNDKIISVYSWILLVKMNSQELSIHFLFWISEVFLRKIYRWENLLPLMWKSFPPS